MDGRDKPAMTLPLRGGSQKAGLLVLVLAARLLEALGMAEGDLRAFAVNDFSGGQDLQL